MILSFQQLKGGAGKTTLALNVAAVLAAEHHSRVLFIDADPQGSALDWSQAREQQRLFPVIGLPRPTIHKELAELAKDYDHVVIDTPPRVSDLARSALMVADMAIMPVTPSQYDVWALSTTVELVKEALVFKPNLRSVIAINRKIAGSVIGRVVTQALSDFEFPVLRTAITHRVAFAEMAGIGQAVIEMDPKGQAAQEVRDMTGEIMRILAGAEVPEIPVVPADTPGHTEAEAV